MLHCDRVAAVRIFLGKTVNGYIRCIEMYVLSSLFGFISRWLQRGSKIVLIVLSL